MFKKLQEKWKVSPRRLGIILLAFALGGSLCGFLGKKIMGFTGLEKGIVYFICYIILITLLWPLCVITISSLLGEYAFFKNYLRKMFLRMAGRKNNQQYRLAIFASGGGSNAAAIMRYFAPHKNKNIVVCLVVSNRAKAGVVAIAESFNVACIIIQQNELANPDMLIKQLQQKGITHIALAGFLQKFPEAILKLYPSKVINIHPALLPKYGGKGMYGHHVHEAVKLNGEGKTGISIHLVNEVYDEGKVLFQEYCEVSETDTATDIAARVLKLEHLHFAPVIESWIIEGSNNSTHL